MVGPITWFRYIATKFEYSVSLSLQSFERGQMTYTETFDSICENVLRGRMTFLHKVKGEEMYPMIGRGIGGTFLVRKIPAADPTRVYVGDVVVLKDPMNPDKYLLRRLAAVEGSAMASTDDKDEPFILEKDQCWVLADNEKLKTKEAYDSRTFGPVTMSTNIVGRAIYCLRSAIDQLTVKNSDISKRQDSPVLEMELDVCEMSKYNKKE